VSMRLQRFVTRTAAVAVAGLGLFLLGTVIWLVDGGPGPAHLFEAGTIDQIGLVVMTVSLIVAIRAIQRPGTPPLPAR
jgi:hypothetical protein